MIRFIQTVRQLSTLCGFAAAALIMAGVIVVCHMVVARFVFGSNTIWQTDFTTYSIVAATFLGSPFVLLTRGHVNVDILPRKLSETGRFYLAMASATMSLAFSFTMAWLAWHYWFDAWTGNWVSDTMWRVRLWIPYAAMPVGFTVLTLQFVVDVYCLAIGEELPFGLALEQEEQTP